MSPVTKGEPVLYNTGDRRIQLVLRRCGWTSWMVLGPFGNGERCDCANVMLPLVVDAYMVRVHVRQMCNARDRH